MGMNPLQKAIDNEGWQPLSASLGVTRQAMRKWLDAGRLPRSEFSGETNYSIVIERATHKVVTASELLEWSRRGWNTQTV